MTNDRLALTINEFRERVGISRSLIYRMIARGELRSVRLGGRRVVPVSEVARLLETDASKAAA